MLDDLLDGRFFFLLLLFLFFGFFDHMLYFFSHGHNLSGFAKHLVGDHQLWLWLVRKLFGSVVRLLPGRLLLDVDFVA
jgi:hypothetical protein